MRNRIYVLMQACIMGVLFQQTVWAHGASKNVTLHVMDERQKEKWDECSFMLDPALNQKAWHQFAQEAGLVTYFRPLTDAAPMGTGNYEFSIMDWMTDIDDTDSAWNDTFIHPDSSHWLMEGDALGFPGLMFRAGVTEQVDIGAYWTDNPGANYGFWGGQLQYNFIHNRPQNWAASARLSFVSLYGPEDIDQTVYGIDLLLSKEYVLSADWLSIAAYGGISGYLSRIHENSAAVDLKDENVFGTQAVVGAVAHISIARLAMEYNAARVNTVSFKIGVGF